MYKRILLPLDGSRRAEIILPHVASLAEKYGAEVILLQVVCPPLMLERDEVVDSARDRSDRQARRRSGLAYLEGVARQFKNPAGVSTLCVEANSVVEAIFDAANRKKADLVAMASHGWGGSVRTFYGSVASGVINKADQPLLIVRSRSFPEPD